MDKMMGDATFTALLALVHSSQPNQKCGSAQLDSSLAMYKPFNSLDRPCSDHQYPDPGTTAIINKYDVIPTGRGYIFPKLSFSCDGTITALSLAAFYSTNRDSLWGKTLYFNVTLWKPSGLTYALDKTVNIPIKQSTEYGLDDTSVHKEAYLLSINTILQVEVPTTIPVSKSNILGLDFPPEVDPWEDAIPLITERDNAYIVLSASSTPCWSADVSMFVDCHSSAGTFKPFIQIEFQEVIATSEPDAAPTALLSTGVLATTSPDKAISSTTNPVPSPSLADKAISCTPENASLPSGILSAAVLFGILFLLAAMLIIGLMVAMVMTSKKHKKTIRFKPSTNVAMVSNPAYSTAHENGDGIPDTMANAEQCYNSQDFKGEYHHLRQDVLQAETTPNELSDNTYNSIDTSGTYKNISTTTVPEDQTAVYSEPRT